MTMHYEARLYVNDVEVLDDGGQYHRPRFRHAELDVVDHWIFHEKMDNPKGDYRIVEVAEREVTA